MSVFVSHIGLVIATHDPEVTDTITIQTDDYEEKRINSLTWGKSSIWYLTSSERIHRLDPQNGQITRSFSTPIRSSERSNGQSHSIAWMNGSLWLLESSTNEKSKIYKLSPKTGRIEETLSISVEFPNSITSNGNSIWLSNSSRMYRINPDKREIIRSFELSVNAYSLAWHGGFIWSSDYIDINQIDPATSDGSVKSSFGIKGTSPRGLAWDDEALWVGSSNGTIQRVNVGDIGQPNTAPTADLNYSPNTPTIGQQVSFTAARSSDGRGFIQSYRWDFDNDDLSDATGKNVTYVFESTGEHKVTLQVIDNDGIHTNITKTIQVTDDKGSVSKNSPTSHTNGQKMSPSTDQSINSTTSKVSDRTGGRKDRATTQPTQFGRTFGIANSIIGIVASLLTIAVYLVEIRRRRK